MADEILHAQFSPLPFCYQFIVDKRGYYSNMNVLNVFGPVTQMLFISFALTAPFEITTSSYIGVWVVKRR